MARRISILEDSLIKLWRNRHDFNGLGERGLKDVVLLRDNPKYEYNANIH